MYLLIAANDPSVAAIRLDVADNAPSIRRELHQSGSKISYALSVAFFSASQFQAAILLGDIGGLSKRCVSWSANYEYVLRSRKMRPRSRPWWRRANTDT